MGGAGYTPEVPGTYFLVFECLGKRTERVPLIVEKSTILSKISATFHFEKSGPIQLGDMIPVSFSVTNDSALPIRFPERGIMMEGVSLRIVREKPASRSDLFYPWEKLSQFAMSPYTYTWELATKLPSVTLEPGQRFEQRLSVEDAYRFEQPGDYEVTFSTVVSILVGDRAGPFAEFCPIRVIAQKTELFTVSDEKR
jgi:hypothetical protein